MKFKIQKKISKNLKNPDEIIAVEYFIKNTKGHIIAEALIDYYLNGKTKEGCICNVETKKRYRKRGLCTQLMTQLVKEHSNECLFLTIDEHCKLGIRVMKKFYKKFGFKPDPDYPNTLWRNENHN